MARKLLSTNSTPRRAPPRLRWLSLLLILPLLWLLALGLSVGFYARASDPGPADAAIVLGAAVADGRPTPVFAERIRHGLTLYQRGAVRRLIMTGGVGAGDSLAESEVARDYCLTRGVPARAILIETRSRTTYENLVFAAELVWQHQLARVLLVSDPLHERRAITIARDLGLDAHPAPTPSSRYRSLASQSQFLAREVWFLAGYLLTRRG